MYTSVNKKEIFVTNPSLPPLEEFYPYLEQIWNNKKLTNGGRYHQELENALASYLGVKHCSLFCNGTIALQVGLQALDIEGDVITTPYSFPATAHAIYWNKCRPIFCDIAENYNLDPVEICRAITPKTTAIVPVHVYGIPCDVDQIQTIAEKHNLKVFYDAAHAFGVHYRGKTIFEFGDLSMVSFHATKIFNTAEGGALITNNGELKKRIDYLKNFGFANEVSIVGPGINGKMNELQAALGMLQLKYVTQEIEKSKQRFMFYGEQLQSIEGIEILHVPDDVTWNYSYCPISVTEFFPINRDALYEELKKHGFFSRRYFYPLITFFDPYKEMTMFQGKQLNKAQTRSERVLCLPLYADLSFEDIDNICNVIRQVAG